MATLVLQAAGSFVGSAFGAWGSAIGSAVGAFAGNYIDQRLFSPSRKQVGPRLDATPPMSANEGTPIARAYGTVRIASTVIWATRLLETENRERTGGKGGGGTTTTTYAYSANFAVALCEGEIAGIRRLWADAKELDLTTMTFRLHRGTQTQTADPLIAAKQGNGNAPAYRGIAYIVFEALDVNRFGNRIPQIELEIIRPVGELEEALTGVHIIPGSTEHGYDPEPVTKVSDGQTLDINRHIRFGRSDWSASMDELAIVAPNVKHASLVVSWFGDDLRARHCTIKPGVTGRDSQEESKPWSVSGLTRQSASTHIVSQHGSQAAYGGSPTDQSVLAAIADLKSRGYAVTVNPFVLMDVPDGNGLPDPHGGAAQAAYPWRGRITCHPAAGQTGSVDQSADAGAQIASFIGTAQASDFAVNASAKTVTEGGGIDWRYRAFILHYAHLAALAGGVDTFLIGSELRGLTRVRDASGSFPFVQALMQLASDVRAILGAHVNIVYSADWSEYFGYHPSDGSGDVFFNLDPLWAHPDIDAIGIDNYMPISDWRDEDAADIGGQPDGFRHHADLAGFMSQIEGGEGFHWYYKSDRDNADRTRTPISDGAHNKPWVFRYKDIRAWWSNRHFDRTNGVERPTPTAWVPRSKPVWLMEIGCSALRGGASQPNLFIDPKSSENGIPRGKTGTPDDYEQRACVLAHVRYWSERANADGGDQTPVDPERIYAWAWDARPYPAFPIAGHVWGDGGNWPTGHWLNGRLGTAPVGALVKAIAADHGVPGVEIGDIPATLDGLVISAPDAARSAIEPILAFFDGAARDDETDTGTIGFDVYNLQPPIDIPVRDLVIEPGKPVRRYTHAQDDELPSAVSVSFRDPQYGYKQIAEVVSPPNGRGVNPVEVQAPGIMRRGPAIRAADSWLRRMRARSVTIDFTLPVNWMGLSTGDVIGFSDLPAGPRWLVRDVTIAADVKVTAQKLASDTASNWNAQTPVPHDDPVLGGDFGGVPDHVFIDTPLRDGRAEEESFLIAARRNGGRSVAVMASPDGETFDLKTTIARDAVIGTLSAQFGSGPVAVWDNRNAIEVQTSGGAFSSQSTLATLSGRNLAAVETSLGWEIIAFANAEEMAPNRWRLTGLLRGLGGTEHLTSLGAETGSKFVLLDDRVVSAGLTAGEVGMDIHWRVGEANRPFTDRYFKTTVLSGGMVASRPLAPVHVAGAMSDDGALTCTWIRRTRSGGDSWAAIEVPLGEDVERYRITLAAATGETATTESSEARLSLDANALTALGLPLNQALTASIAQVSLTVGAGTTTQTTIQQGEPG
ncbi:MAG: glycoside hydrolase/phage tail family protein [Pseudomonadota bacterium]